MARSVGVGTSLCLAGLAMLVIKTSPSAIIQPAIHGALAAGPHDLELQWWGHLAIAGVVGIVGAGIERMGAKRGTIAALAALTVACFLLGVAPSPVFYVTARSLQLAAMSGALVGLATWALPAFHPRAWGLALAVVMSFHQLVVSNVLDFAQAVSGNIAGWRVIPLVAAVLVAAAAVSLVWMPAPATDLESRVASVFGPEPPAPGTTFGRPAWRPPIALAVGVMSTSLLVGTAYLVLPVGFWNAQSALLILALRASAILVVGSLAFRISPARIGVACCAILLVGYGAVAAGLYARGGVYDPMPWGLILTAITAQFVFAVSAIRQGACTLGLSAGLTVASIFATWAIMGLLTHSTGLDLSAAAEKIGIGLALVGIVAGLVGGRARIDDPVG